MDKIFPFGEFESYEDRIIFENLIEGFIVSVCPKCKNKQKIQPDESKYKCVKCDSILLSPIEDPKHFGGKSAKN